ncbi:MAG: Wzt carbohydrate-binding domain-containing protein [Candidatus Woesearchaeota archaeon]
MPPYQNPLFKFEISSLKNKPLSLCSLLEKGSKDYTGIALKIADETLGMFIPIAQDLCRKVGVKLYNNEDYLKIDAYAISQYVKEEFLHAIEADLGILKRRELLKKKCLYDYYAFALRKNIYDEMARTKDQAKIEKKIEELIKILRIGLKNNFDNKDILKGELADVLNKKAALPFLNIRERIKAEEEAREIRNTIKNYNTDPNLIRKKIEEYELLMRELKLKTNDKLTITKIKNYIRILKEDLRKNKNREALTKKLGIIKIRNVKFLNKKMYPSHIFRSEDQMIIKIDYHALRKVENPVFGIAFYSEDGVHIAGPNTRFSGLKIKYVKGKGSVFFKINKLPLLEEKYFVTVAVHPYKSFEPYDVHIKRYSFKVVDSPPEPGFLHLDSEWIISKQKQ